MRMSEPPELQGLRRNLTREYFEELGSYQCELSEILGHIGTTKERLDKWCRKVYRNHSAEEMLQMTRQDGLIAIRRASFEQLRKSATLVSQQYNRFLPTAAHDEREDADAAIRAFTEIMSGIPEAETRKLFEE